MNYRDLNNNNCNIETQKWMCSFNIIISKLTNAGKINAFLQLHQNIIYKCKRWFNSNFMNILSFCVVLQALDNFVEMWKHLPTLYFHFSLSGTEVLEYQHYNVKLTLVYAYYYFIMKWVYGHLIGKLFSIYFHHSKELV